MIQNWIVYSGLCAFFFICSRVCYKVGFKRGYFHGYSDFWIKSIKKSFPKTWCELERKVKERRKLNAEGDNCIRCGNPIDHNDPHLYCSNCD